MKKITYRIAICCILLASLLATFLPIQVSPLKASATETLRPNAAGDETGIANQTPETGSHWDKVDEAVSDEWGTAVYTSSGGEGWERDLYNLPALSGFASINSVTIYARVTVQSETGYVKISQKSGATVTDGTSQSFVTWATKSQTYTTNPATGVAYTWDDIDTLQIGVSLYHTGYYSACTQVYVVVDFNSISSPTLTTSAAINIASTTATLSGNVTDTGGENPEVLVYWGESDGGTNPASWTNNSTPTSPSQPQGVAAFYKNATGLIPNTLYYFSASANNSAGTSWATSQNFTTDEEAVPTLTTLAATQIQAFAAFGSGNITDLGTGANCTVWGFEWGFEPGVYTTNMTQSGSQGLGVFSANMTPLGPNVTHYYRAMAYNAKGWGYGNELYFHTMWAVGGPTADTSEGWQMISDAEAALLITAPEGLYREGGTDFPGGGEVQKTADKMRLPVEVLLYPLAIISSLAAGLLVMKWTHRPEKGVRGSLFLQACVTLACMIFWVYIGGGVISGWLLVPFGLWAIIAFIFRNPYNPVTS